MRRSSATHSDMRYLPDLVPGMRYLSPTGRPCVLLASPEVGPNRDNLHFRYLDGKKGEDEGFLLSRGNIRALCALFELL